MRIKRVVFSVLRMLEKRPWFLAVVHFFLFALAGMGYVVLASNQCLSQLRLWPELSDRFFVVVATVCGIAIKASSVLGVAVIVAPILPLLCGRWCTVRRMVIAAFMTMGVVYGCFAYLFGHIEGSIRGDIKVAQINLKNQAESVRTGKPYQRIPLSKLERRVWYFAEDRYCLLKVDSGTIYLYDDKFEPLNREHTLWRERLLLEDVKSWNDGGDRLLLTTMSGDCAVLIYKTGEIKMLKEERTK